MFISEPFSGFRQRGRGGRIEPLTSKGGKKGPFRNVRGRVRSQLRSRAQDSRRERDGEEERNRQTQLQGSEMTTE